MDVDLLNTRIRQETRKREELRLAGASREELERNRLEIVRLQWELSRALIAAHLPTAA